MGANKLGRFLAHSVALESEAQERYLELAEVMAAHDNRPVADFFRRMADEASLHLLEVTKIAVEVPLPQLKAWEFEWPEMEAPETTSHEAVYSRMSLRQAMLLALDNECAAEQYYRHVSQTSGDAETARIAADFADEELSHAAALKRLLANLPPDDAPRLHEDSGPVRHTRCQSLVDQLSRLPIFLAPKPM
ncbi:MAG: ferritin family protein [Halioglobus sp.]|nr:ferritin family protein [Halioglobus sp.]